MNSQPLDQRQPPRRRLAADAGASRHARFGKLSLLAVAIGGLAACASETRGQHCAPITEAFLGRIEVRHTPAGGDSNRAGGERVSFDVNVEFCKSGGRRKSHYQIYLLAYRSQHARRVPAAAPSPLIDEKIVRVLKTDVCRNQAGETRLSRYEFKFSIDEQELARQLIDFGALKDRVDDEGRPVGPFDDSIRLAVFVPWLADKEHATLPGLPEDRHECNYTATRALLFQVLPISLHPRRTPVAGAAPPRDRFEIDLRGA